MPDIILMTAASKQFNLKATEYTGRYGEATAKLTLKVQNKKRDYGKLAKARKVRYY